MPEEEGIALLEPDLDPNFMVTPSIAKVEEHALAYLQADLPIHFCGPAGTGKTAMALHVAAKLKRPIVLIHGDDEFKTADLVGAEYGFRLRRLRDEYIHHVTKVEEDLVKHWVDNRLTVAVKNGFTLVYDEFTRSKPEANNTLLSVLEEKLLDLPAMGQEDERYIPVHPQFRAIFTSNPEEYAGVHKAQDALRDRLVTIEMDYFDRDTEVAAIQKRTGVSLEDAQTIVDLVRSFRERCHWKGLPSLRECLKIARVLKTKKTHPSKTDPFFTVLCQHVLATGPSMADPKHKAEAMKVIDELIKKVS
jgi:gas vesicle protein GvpN